MRAMPAMVGAAALDWAMKLTGQRVETLEKHLADTVPGASGVRVLPFLAESGERAPFKDRLACGRSMGFVSELPTPKFLEHFARQ